MASDLNPTTILQPPTLALNLVGKIESRTARIGIIGMGYVGLPLALLFSEERFPVTGFDIEATKVKTLRDDRDRPLRLRLPANRGRIATGG